MTKTFEHLISERALGMRENVIREILKVVSQPGMISLAGGIPAPETFPIEELYRINETVLDRYGAAALQYDRTEGFTPFREALVGYLAQKEIRADAANLLVFNGSQSVLDTLGKILITPGDVIALESPSYLGAISAFSSYLPEYISVETDDDGIVPESLERALDQQPIKFIYLVTTFQNPTGRTLSVERRREVAAIIKAKNALVIEDDPYGDLRYRGQPVPPLQTFAPENVVYVSTLSKVFAPGLRLGFCVAPPLDPRVAVPREARRRLAHQHLCAGAGDGVYMRRIHRTASAKDHRTLSPAARGDAGGAGTPHARRLPLDQAGRRHVHLGRGTAGC